MNYDLTVSESVEINASPEKVWQGLTDPSIIKEYLFGTNTKTDWKPGSPVYFEGEWENQTYQDKGIIKEFRPYEEISYTYWSGFMGLEDKLENYSIVTYKVLKLDNDRSLFTWSQQGFASEAGYNHSKSGMKEFLQKVKEVIEAHSKS